MFTSSQLTDISYESAKIINKVIKSSKLVLFQQQQQQQQQQYVVCSSTA
jgi:hypothetical protein